MGAVYLARDSQLDRLVALKVPLFGQAAEQAVVERFQREVRAAASIRHPHVCPIHDVGQVDGTVFMTMAYIEGKTLAQHVQGRPSPSVRSAAELARKLALALEEAHRSGVIHRDLKPANIMLDHRGEPIVMDFGLAWRPTVPDVRLTQSGAVVGTIAYMSPEQLAGKTPGPASDIYSLGVILYELLAGRLPFGGELLEMLTHIASDLPPPPSHWRSEIPPALDTICQKALAKAPADRQASMAILAAELAGVLGSEDVGQGILDESTESTRHFSTSNAAEPAGLRTAEPGSLSRLTIAMHVLVFVGGGGLALAVLLLAALRPNPSRTGAPAAPSQGPELRSADRTGIAAARPPKSESATAGDESLSRLITGRYLCFVEENWEQGLALLSECSDPDLRSLAIRDLETSRQPTHDAAYCQAALQLGNLWQQRAANEASAVVSRALRERARYWFQSSLPGLDGTDRTAVERWLHENPPVAVSGEPAAVSQEGSGAPRENPESQVAAAVPQVDAKPSGAAPAPIAAKPDAGAAVPMAKNPPPAPPANVRVPSEPERDAKATPLATAMTQLQQLTQERQSLITEINSALQRRDVELGEDYVTATAEYSRLNRLGQEANREVQAWNLQLAALEREYGATNDAIQRLRIQHNAELVRQRRDGMVQQFNMLAAEARGKSVDVARLESEHKVISGQVQSLATTGQQLLERAFWAAQPTGWLESDEYAQIGEVFLQWSRDSWERPSSLALRAIATANAGRVEEAVRDANQARAINRQTALCIAARGYALSKNGDPGEGISDISRAIRLSPQAASFYLLRGLAYEMAGNYKSAWQDFDRTVTLDKRQPWGYCHRVLAALQLPAELLIAPQDMINQAQLACELSNRQSWFCLDVLASAYARAEMTDEAVTTQQLAVQLAPPARQVELAKRLQKYQDAQQPHRE
jgi:serine/threonine protein kinase/tetratricopeptide (TPR) repeat protein